MVLWATPLISELNNYTNLIELRDKDYLCEIWDIQVREGLICGLLAYNRGPALSKVPHTEGTLSFRLKTMNNTY